MAARRPLDGAAAAKSDSVSGIRARTIDDRGVTPLLFAPAATDSAALVWGMLFGAFGLGFFVYGKKQRRVVPFVAGIVLSVLPFFVADTLLLVVTGLATASAPFLLRGI
jgi:hypothetical protein